MRCDYKQGEKGFQSMNPAAHKSEHNQKRLTSAFNHRCRDVTCRNYDNVMLFMWLKKWIKILRRKQKFHNRTKREQKYHSKLALNFCSTTLQNFLILHAIYRHRRYFSNEKSKSIRFCKRQQAENDIVEHSFDVLLSVFPPTKFFKFSFNRFSPSRGCFIWIQWCM